MKTNAYRMYKDLRKHLTPMISYQLVKEKYPNLDSGMADYEAYRLKEHFKRSC